MEFDTYSVTVQYTENIVIDIFRDNQNRGGLFQSTPFNAPQLLVQGLVGHTYSIDRCTRKTHIGWPMWHSFPQHTDLSTPV